MASCFNCSSHRILHVLKSVDTMEYKRIVAVTGLPGLFEVVSTKSDGAIRAVSRRIKAQNLLLPVCIIFRISKALKFLLKKIMLTLLNVFNAMRESTEALPDVKDNKALKAYFEKVYGDIDFERVYTWI